MKRDVHVHGSFQFSPRVLQVYVAAIQLFVSIDQVYSYSNTMFPEPFCVYVFVVRGSEETKIESQMVART